MKRIQYKDLTTNDIFWCWGDTLIGYDYPKFCKCRKDEDRRAWEFGGVYFLINPESYVLIEV